MRVALFVPCYVDQLAPDTAMATLRVLESVGCEVHYDPEQTCCGQPFLNLGALRETRGLAERHAARFRGFDAVVSPSASCVATIRAHYPKLGLSGMLPARTFELGEFLVRKLGRTQLGARFPRRVAILQSCHGVRTLGLARASELGPAGKARAGPGTTEQLLNQVTGLRLVTPERADECCGFGGAFSLKLPEVSARVGRARLTALQECGAEVVTGTDTSCLLHLEGLRRRLGFGPEPVGLAEILASGIDP